MSRSLLRTLVLCTGFLATAPLFAAEDRGLLDDKFTLSLGTFFLNTETTLALRGTAGQVGTEVDLEQDLGLDSGDRFRADANWRISGRHHVRALYFDYGNSKSRTLDRELVIGDTTYPVNVTVEAKLSTTIYELAYEYAFWERENWELLGSIGAHVARFSFSVRGNGTVAGQPVNARTESASATAPLPVVGGRYVWRFAPDWYLEAQAQYFKISIDNIDGEIIDMRAGVNWMFTDHFGVGLGWNDFTTDVDVGKERFDGSLDWRYSGAQVYITGSF